MYGPHSTLPCTLLPLHFRVGGDLSGRSEGIVLRGDLSDVIVADDGHLAEDVISNLGDFAEEEEGEDSGRDTEARCYAAAVEGACVSRSLSLCH